MIGEASSGQLSPEDFCLHLPSPHGHLLLKANGYECGFSTCGPRVSRCFLELFRDAWFEQGFQVERKPRRALRLAFCQTARRLVAKTRDWVEDDFLGGIAACATAVYVIEARAICAWIGSVHAGMLVQGQLVNENTVDTGAGRAASLGRKSSPSLRFRVADGQELEPQLVDWALPEAGEILLALKSFPNKMSLQELLDLRDLTPKQAQQWCQKNDTGFYCMMRWVF